jgi:hypothetical protein
LNKEYHFEISQQTNSKGEAVYSIKVNGETFHEIVNTTPLKFKDVKLYLSDPWYETFAPFGKLSNLKIIADLTKIGKYFDDNPEILLGFQIRGAISNVVGLICPLSWNRNN